MGIYTNETARFHFDNLSGHKNGQCTTARNAMAGYKKATLSIRFDHNGGFQELQNTIPERRNSVTILLRMRPAQSCVVDTV